MVSDRVSSAVTFIDIGMDFGGVCCMGEAGQKFVSGGAGSLVSRHCGNDDIGEMMLFQKMADG